LVKQALAIIQGARHCLVFVGIDADIAVQITAVSSLHLRFDFHKLYFSYCELSLE
jgi:hypothetical protein